MLVCQVHVQGPSGTQCVLKLGGCGSATDTICDLLYPLVNGHVLCELTQRTHSLGASSKPVTSYSFIH